MILMIGFIVLFYNGFAYADDSRVSLPYVMSVTNNEQAFMFEPIIEEEPKNIITLDAYLKQQQQARIAKEMAELTAQQQKENGVLKGEELSPPLQRIRTNIAQAKQAEGDSLVQKIFGSGFYHLKDKTGQTLLTAFRISSLVSMSTQGDKG